MDTPTPPAPAPTPAVPVQSGTSNDTRTIVTVLCLLFIFPIGLILMWFWTKWPLWVKLVISILPLFLVALIGVFAVAILTTINPEAQIEKANCVKQCQGSANRQTCVSQCLTPSPTNNQVVPKPSPSTSSSRVDTSNWKTHTDETLKILFKYPSTWQVKTSANNITLTKNQIWAELNFKTDFKPGGCGGMLGSTDQNYIDTTSKLKQIAFLGEQAYRNKLEGDYWSAADEPEPFTQPVFFTRPTYKATEKNGELAGQNLHDLAFCYENTTRPMSISVSFSGDSFTRKDIENQLLDYATLNEMDQILSTFKFLD